MFSKSGGKKFVFRYPKISDSENIWRFYNKAIKEALKKGGNISSIKQVSLADEKKWVRDSIKKDENRKSVHIFVEYDNRIIGNSSIEKVGQAKNHVGNFGIVLLEKFTGKGIGARLMNKTIQLSKSKLRLEAIELRVFGNNKRAQNLYKKMGFKKVGRIKRGIKIKNSYQDDVIMVRYL